MHDRPAISVLMSVFNAQPYLRAAVDSILAQTFRDFEFVIVDDGSTDGSSAVLSECAAADSRIKLVRSANQGLTKALNLGLAQATGDFVARMDADDLSLPDRFERQVAYLQAHPQCIALGGGVLCIDSDGDRIAVELPPAEHDAIDSRNLEGPHGGIPHPTAMLRRDALVAVNGYRECFTAAQDLDLFLRLGERGALANLDQVVLKYRQHSKSVGAARFDEQRRCAAIAVRDARERRGLPAKMADVAPANNGYDGPALSDWQIRSFWVRRACGAGNYRTARKHAWRCWRQRPTHLDAYKLLLHAALGPVDRQVVRLARWVRQLCPAKSAPPAC